MLPSTIPLIFLALAAGASALVQGDCASSDAGLKWLASVIDKKTAISCKGQPLQQHNAGRYFGTQNSVSASVVVFPATKKDVQNAVQAANKSSLGSNFAFVGGAYGQTNAASASGFIIDLSWLNSTQVLKNVKVADTTIPAAISYQGGATWRQVQAATTNSGYTAVGARVGDVGVGGFSTSGGTGYLAGAYGFASDRLAAAEVVLMSGSIVNATKTNDYKDLFFALQGGGGQFGIVVTFYQIAAPEPKIADVGFHVIDDGHLSLARQQTVDWFNTNKDPFSLMFFVVGYIPSSITSGPFAVKTLLFTIRIADPTSKSQASYSTTFSTLLKGLNTTAHLLQPSVPFSDMSDWIDAYFPTSYRRGFTGASLSAPTAAYLTTATTQLQSHVAALLKAGDDPRSALWALQYIHPTLNGHIPSSDAATAWPHARVGHQALFSPAWKNVKNDAAVTSQAAAFVSLTRKLQQRSGKKALADNPGYALPSTVGSLTFGDNSGRLIDLKQKYDPECRLRRGRVFPSRGCVEGGWANI
ncbi:FAD binding domain protein [Myriangium duriaei CBS 260.36]|uniref:FAD binding domain protein n=1 Tax=Myriangium duriaei CBS 260.36 TaxID=1168546 RepID=A0A9P4ITS5_9PEZI|nr:FAD binding domain protein [Myriangium duriaei CBS 260.36]